MVLMMVMITTMTIIRPECCPVTCLLPTGNDNDNDLNDNEDDGDYSDGVDDDDDYNNDDDQTRVLPGGLPLAHWHSGPSRPPSTFNKLLLCHRHLLLFILLSVIITTIAFSFSFLAHHHSFHRFHLQTDYNHPILYV